MVVVDFTTFPQRWVNVGKTTVGGSTLGQHWYNVGISMVGFWSVGPTLKSDWKPTSLFTWLAKHWHIVVFLCWCNNAVIYALLYFYFYYHYNQNKQIFSEICTFIFSHFFIKRCYFVIRHLIIHIIINYFLKFISLN